MNFHPVETIPFYYKQMPLFIRRIEFCRLPENSFELYRKTQRDATYQNQVNICSFLELHACLYCDFHYGFVIMGTVKFSNYAKVTYSNTIYASFLGRRWPCILWVSLIRKPMS
jgi:hypothetical protein